MRAGFGSRFSMTDNIHVVNQVKENCREYNISFCIAFIDYEKAFDSLQTQVVLTSLQEQGIEYVYIKLLNDIYTNSSMTVHIHKESNTSASGEEYNREIPYCPSCLQQHSNAYSAN